MENVLWKQIPSFEGYYEVSNYGVIRSVDRMIKHSKNGYFLKKGSIKKASLNRFTGYYSVCLHKNNIQKRIYVHRAVLSAFTRDYPKMDVNHKDGDKSNNSLSNLEWCTRKENINHAVRITGKFGPMGESHWNNKLSNDDIGEIVNLRKSGYKLKQLSEIYGVSDSHISNIVNGKKRVSYPSSPSILSAKETS